MTEISKNIIFIEEYGLYQYFSEGKSFFTHDASYDRKNDFSEKAIGAFDNPAIVMPDEDEKQNRFISMAVISKNIIFSKISESENDGRLQTTKKRKISKYLSRYYKNESYFAVPGQNNFMGIYHTSPANVKKYYSVPGVVLVIPYDFLVVLFLRKKLPSFENDSDALLFIEKGAGIYKITVILKGLSFFPVASFKEDMLNDNLAILKNKLAAAGISIRTIVANTDMAPIGELFYQASVLEYSSEEFFAFFGAIGVDTPHFENIEVRFKKIGDRKNKILALYIASEAIMITAACLALIIVKNAVRSEAIRSKILNKEITNISLLLKRKKEEQLFKKEFSPVNSWKYLENVMNILPKGSEISYLYLMRPGLRNYYVVTGKALFKSGYYGFAANYDRILKKSLSFKHLRLAYDLNKFESPFVRFYGKIEISKNNFK